MNHFEQSEAVIWDQGRHKACQYIRTRAGARPALTVAVNAVDGDGFLTGGDPH